MRCNVFFQAALPVSQSLPRGKTLSFGDGGWEGFEAYRELLLYVIPV